jgi:serine/threonine-protein kinase
MCCKLFERPSQARWEVGALGRIAHPGVVRMLEDGAPRYMLTEFLEGPSLRKLLQSRPRHRVGLSDGLRTAIHLGAALAHLHANRYLHLDVKPRNVIVTRRRPVLFDLGSALRLDGRKPSSPHGTDAYMSPEQCRSEVPSPASDVYGLGVTLFEMLAGTRPFPKGDKAEPFPQLHLAPARLRDHVPSAPRELEALVAACLAQRVADRPQSMAELLPALHRLIRSGPRMWPAGLGLPEPAAYAAPSAITSPVDASCAIRARPRPPAATAAKDTGRAAPFQVPRSASARTALT